MAKYKLIGAVPYETKTISVLVPETNVQEHFRESY